MERARDNPSRCQENTEKMKRKLLILAVLAVVSLASCQKTCVCTGYDGSERTYTEEEVDARGVSCSNMIIQARTRFYSYCRWE